MGRKMLIVEDEKPIADILQYHFQKEGFSIACIYNGEEALDLVEDTQPDIILLDVMLPGLDGIEVCRKLRLKYKMPIIMMTASDSDYTKNHAFDFGASDYITKPFHTKELVALVKQCLPSC